MVAQVLIGRERELAAIDASLRRLEAGAGGAMLVRGPGGVGKTALIQSAAARASAIGARVMLGRAAEFERDRPFSAIADALRHVGANGTESHALTLPGLGRGAPDRESVQALVEGMAQHRPTLLVVDDLQWSDVDSLVLLAGLTGCTRALPLLVIGASRPGPSLAPLENAARAVDLEPLEAEAATTLLNAYGLPPSVRRQVARVAQGMPRCLEVLAQHHSAARLLDRPWIEGGIVRRLPDALVGSARCELRACTDDALALMRAGAVLGDQFDLAVAARIAEVALDTAASGADQAIGAGLLRAGAGGMIGFRDRVVRQVTYESAGPGWRYIAHDRARRYLDATGAGAAELAPHVDATAALGDREAAATLRDAAVVVSAVSPPVAVRYCRAARRLLGDGDPGETSSVLAVEAGALASSGRLQAALAGWRAVRSRSVRETIELARVEASMGNDRSALRRLAHLTSPDRDTAALLSLAVAKAHLAGRRLASSALAARAARDAAHDGSDLIVAAGAAAFAAMVLSHVDVPAAGAALDDAMAQLNELEDHQLLDHCEAIVDASVAATILGRFDSASWLTDRGLSISVPAGRDAASIGLHLARAEVQVRTGDIADARRSGAAAIELASDGPDALLLRLACARQAFTLARVGDLDEASHMLQRAEAAQATVTNPMRAREAYAGLLIDVGSGRPRRAVARLWGGMGGGLTLVLPGERMWAWAALAHASRELGDLESMRRWAREARERAQQSGLDADGAWRLRIEAMESADLDAARAAELARASAELFGRAGQPLERLRSCALQARLLAQTDPGSAGELLATTDAALDLLGLSPAGRAVVQEGGATRAAEADARLDVLSAREREIALLVAEGITNAQIAASIRRSQRTVEAHLRNIFFKLGVDSRAELAATVARALASPSPP